MSIFEVKLLNEGRGRYARAKRSDKSSAETLR